MAGIAVATTTFVLGREVDGNREIRTFLTGQEYDLDYAYALDYSDDNTQFPYSV